MKKLKLKIKGFLLYIRVFFINLFLKNKHTHAFYYSKKQNEIIEDYSYSLGKKKYKATFKGKEYTEMKQFKDGWCNWDDSKLIGIGRDENIILKPIN